MNDLWLNLTELARLWRLSPVVERFIHQLPPNHVSTSQVTKDLQEFEAAYHLGQARPLRLGSFLSTLGWTDASTDAHEAFLEDSQRIESAAHETVAWFRAGLPRYPTFPVPQLARGSSRVHYGFSEVLPWFPEALASGLQFKPYPEVLVDLALYEHERELKASTTDVARALAQTPEWLAFAETSSHLTNEDRNHLKAARQEIRDALSEDKIDVYEPTLALPRTQFRRSKTNEVVAALSGSAFAFAESFDAVDDTINLVADVFGQLVAYGPPVHVGSVANLTISPGEIEFTTDKPLFLGGSLYRIDDPLVGEILLERSMNVDLDPNADQRCRVKATILQGSALT